MMMQSTYKDVMQHTLGWAFPLVYFSITSINL